MTAKDLRALDQTELQTKLKDLAKEQFLVKMQIGNGQLNKTHKLGDMRREVARLNTILNEKRRG
tara:strand:- start:19896 stop:20087 length:192 start_codon:yes stop_codon:yes gene_type:complete